MEPLKFLETDGAIKTVYRIYDRDEESLQEDVTTLKKWMKSQPHLPEFLDDKSVQNFFILNKCSIERAKRSIDMYHTVRALIPNIYQHVNPKCSNMKEMMEIADWVVLPKLTKEKHRVTIFKMRNKDMVNKMDPHNVVSLFLNIQEVRLREDVMIGDVHIMDMEGNNFGYVAKLTPTFLTKVVFIYEKVFSIPSKGTYIVNSPPFMTTLLLTVKALIKAKLFERVMKRQSYLDTKAIKLNLLSRIWGRGDNNNFIVEIHVCEDTSILSEKFPKEILPIDYGGDERSIRELQEQLNLKLSQYQGHFDKLDKLKVDESLRPVKLENDEILGFHGNFKKLNVD